MSTRLAILTRPLLHLTLVLLATLAPSAFSQDAKPAATAGDDDAAVLPFIDEGTFVVARLDVDRVDPEAFAKYMEGVVEMVLKQSGVPAAQMADVQKEAMGTVTAAKTWLTDMSAAGGKRVYVLVDQVDQSTSEGGGPVIVVPVGEGADAAKIRATLTGDGTGAMEVEEVGKAVVVAMQPAMERVKKLADGSTKPAARPDLPRAFDLAGKDVPLRIAFVPGEATRKWIEENMPKLPGELGGGDVKQVSRGIAFAGVGMTQKPATMANAAVRATDAAQAKALFELLDKGAQAAKKAAAAGPMAELFAKQFDAYKLTVEGDTVRFNIDPIIMIPRRVEHEIDAPAAQPGQPGQPAEPAKPSEGL
jgi:hypothetical protein